MCHVRCRRRKFCVINLVPTVVNRPVRTTVDYGQNRAHPFVVAELSVEVTPSVGEMQTTSEVACFYIDETFRSLSSSVLAMRLSVRLSAHQPHPRYHQPSSKPTTLLPHASSGITRYPGTTRTTSLNRAELRFRGLLGQRKFSSKRYPFPYNIRDP